MITFEITCPHCNKTINVTEEANGKEITCRYCLGRLFIDLGIEPQPKPADPQPKQQQSQMPPQTPPQPQTPPPQPQTQSWTPQPQQPKTQKRTLSIAISQQEDTDFHEPLLCKVFYYLKLINGIAAAISAFSTVVCIVTAEPEGVVAGISLLVTGINFLLCHAAEEYLYRSLRYKWETANNTADIVRLLQNKKP